MLIRSLGPALLASSVVERAIAPQLERDGTAERRGPATAVRVDDRREPTDECERLRRANLGPPRQCERFEIAG